MGGPSYNRWRSLNSPLQTHFTRRILLVHACVIVLKPILTVVHARLYFFNKWWYQGNLLRSRLYIYQGPRSWTSGKKKGLWTKWHNQELIRSALWDAECRVLDAFLFHGYLPVTRSRFEKIVSGPISLKCPESETIERSHHLSGYLTAGRLHEILSFLPFSSRWLLVIWMESGSSGSPVLTSISLRLKWLLFADEYW